MFTCVKWENLAGGAGLLVSKDLKEEGRGGAPSRETHVREVRACRSPQTFRAGAEVSSVSKSHTEPESGSGIPLQWLAHLLWGLESPCSLFSQPQAGVRSPEVGHAWDPSACSLP